MISIKRILLLTLITLSMSIYGQRKVEFALQDDINTYGPELCLSSQTNYDQVRLRFVKGSEQDLSALKVKISLSDSISYTFNSYAEMLNVDAKSWLQSHDAFKKFNNINFDIKATLTSGEILTQEINVCLKQATDGNTRSLTTTTKKEPFVRVPVWFATDRNDTKSSDHNERFGGKRSDKMHYGLCEVSIPNIHKVGEIESPVWWKFEFSEDPKKHMVIQKIQLKDKESYFKQMSEKINQSSEKSSFLFVHGYNVSFASAAKRTAQITYDLNFDGEAVFYSWPSKASTTSYTMDEATIQWSKLNMRNFLEDYLSKTSAENIYLVAHSMGNRGLTRAIIELMNDRPELNKKIKEIILAAPDIDADVFRRDIAPKMVQKVKKPITLYVSADDVALQASHKVHGNPRAGDAGASLVLVDGVETIDASGVDTSFLSHSYFADTNTIIEDILEMIKSGRRAAYRQTLSLIKAAGKVYWKVIAND